MIKTRIIELVVTPGDPTPTERPRGYCMLGEPIMERKVPEPNPNGKMPVPMLIQIEGKRYYVIGFSWDITTVSESEDNPPPAIYILIVQAVPEPSRIVTANANDLKKIEAMVPKPGRVN